MSFRHGIFYNELATSIVPTLTVATPTVVVGTAPLHLATNPAPVNTPVLCSTYADYVAQFGWSGDVETYSCEEAAYVHFQLYSIKPLVVINVLDPATHFKAGSKTVSGASNPLRFKNSKVLLDSLTVKSGETDFVKDTDYTAAFDDTTLVITVKSLNKLVNDSVTLSYNL
ncbi:MAG: phage tail sheath family protein, partial [Selenomonadaceae bacterium]|nr:phage tail sheath family protein [Selenomonadaceae bacterium]